MKPMVVDVPQPTYAHLDYGPHGFTLNGSPHISIRFTEDGAYVGCHKVYAKAMNELCARWAKFCQRLKEEVVQ